MRSLSSATWTSGEPVSASWVAIAADELPSCVHSSALGALHERSRARWGAGPDRRHTATSDAMSHKDQMLSEDDDRMQSAAPRAGPGRPAARRPPESGPAAGAVAGGTQRPCQVLRAERIAVQRPAAGRPRSGGPPARSGRASAGDEQPRRDAPAQPLGVLERQRRPRRRTSRCAVRRRASQMGAAPELVARGRARAPARRTRLTPSRRTMHPVALAPGAVELVHGHGHRLERDRLRAPGQLVRASAADLLGGMLGGSCSNVPAKRRERRDRPPRPSGSADAGSPSGCAVGVVGVGGEAETDGRFVGLVAAAERTTPAASRGRGRAAAGPSRAGRACPCGRCCARPSVRRSRATTSCDVGPDGLSMSRTPSMRIAERLTRESASDRFADGVDRSAALTVGVVAA